jgi:hypothetical protein
MEDRKRRAISLDGVPAAPPEPAGEGAATHSFPNDGIVDLLTWSASVSIPVLDGSQVVLTGLQVGEVRPVRLPDGRLVRVTREAPPVTLNASEDVFVAAMHDRDTSRYVVPFACSDPRIRLADGRIHDCGFVMSGTTKRFRIDGHDYMVERERRTQYPDWTPPPPQAPPPYTNPHQQPEPWAKTWGGRMLQVLRAAAAVKPKEAK